MGTPARQCHVGKPPMETRLRATDTIADRDCRSRLFPWKDLQLVGRMRSLSFKHELFDELFLDDIKSVILILHPRKNPKGVGY